MKLYGEYNLPTRPGVGDAVSNKRYAELCYNLFVWKAQMLGIKSLSGNKMLVYGLSPAGLAENLTATLGRVVTVEEAKAIIDQFFEAYPKIKEFLDESKKACLQLGYVETAFGRRRYFPGVTSLSRDKQAAAQREATNARIQGTVADMLNIACIHLDNMRYDQEIGRMMEWELVVCIHDAILVLVREEHAQIMAGVLDYCMSACVEVPGTNGRHLSVDTQAGVRWQEFEDIKPKHAA